MSQSQKSSRRSFLAAVAAVPAVAIPAIPAAPAAPAVPEVPGAPKTLREKAEKLRALSGGRLEFHRAGSEPGILTAWPDLQRYGDEFEALVLDEQAGPLPPQLVAELRRVGKFYFRLAKKVEAAIA